MLSQHPAHVAISLPRIPNLIPFGFNPLRREALRFGILDRIQERGRRVNYCFGGALRQFGSFCILVVDVIWKEEVVGVVEYCCRYPGLAIASNPVMLGHHQVFLSNTFESRFTFAACRL